MKIKEKDYKQFTEEQKIALINTDVFVVLDTDEEILKGIYEIKYDFFHYIKEYDKEFCEKYKLLFEEDIDDGNFRTIKHTWFKNPKGDIISGKTSSKMADWIIETNYVVVDKESLNEKN